MFEPFAGNRLRPSRLAAGAILALLSLWVSSAAIAPNIHVTALAGAFALHTAIPSVDLQAAYFNDLPVVHALDTNGDLVISAEEIAAASVALRAVDRNGDGTLDGRECGGSSVWPGYGAHFMSLHPVLNALDADHDGIVSAAEIAGSPAALASLDLNRDGQLTPNEVLPRP